MWLQRLGLWDQRCFLALFNKSERKRIHQFSFWCSKTGDGPLYLLLVALLFAFELTHASAFTELLLLSFTIELPLYLLLKNSIRRQRPYQLLAGMMQAHIEASDKFSLPSGHTAAAFVVASTLLCFYPQWAWLAFSWAGLIGLSRILLGVHFPLDILAGSSLGVSSCLVAQQILH